MSRSLPFPDATGHCSHALINRLLPYTLPPIHLEHIMPFNTLHCLPQTPGPPMLMIWLGSLVLMENNTHPGYFGYRYSLYSSIRCQQI